MKRRSVMQSLLPIYVLMFFCVFIVATLIDRSVITIAENQMLAERKCIVIDPGHGGIDGGATSCTGILESNINLEIALKLNDLMHYIGIDTVLIRNCDQSIHTEGTSIAQKKISDLKNRVNIVNNQDDAILISIHQNHFPDEKYYGPQVFYGKTGESRELAIQLQDSLTKSLCPENKRKAKAASGIYLMDKIDRVGVLIECGFISNYEEATKLTTPDYQKQLCCVVGSVTACYLNGAMIS